MFKLRVNDTNFDDLPVYLGDGDQKLVGEIMIDGKYLLKKGEEIHLH